MSEDAHHNSFTPPELDEIAALLPQFEILSFIAKGGMGAVYRAKQKSLDREVAIKILPRSFGEDEIFRSSFEAEAKSMAKLNHPNLTGIYDFGQIDGMLYIVMEMVHGGSLYHASYGKKIDPAEAGRIISEICNGLDNAHQQGILHRDIKPANILLDDKLSPKISDFGLARPVGDHEADTAYGTPGYTAPEVVHNPSAVDESTDLYSVGAMLYELLTGKLPERPYMPAATLVDCDPRFDDIVRKAMNGDPILRFRTAKSMAEAIEYIINEKKSASNNSKLITATGTQASSPPPAGAASPPVVTNKSSSPIIRNVFIILLLLAAIYGSWTFYQKKKTSREAENAQIIAENERKKVEVTEKKIKYKKQRKAEAEIRDQNRLSSKGPVKSSNLNTEQQRTTIQRTKPKSRVYEKCPELEQIKEKCTSLTQKIKGKADEKLAYNTKSYGLDLKYYLRGLPKNQQSEIAPYIEEMKNLDDDGHIPSNFSKIGMPNKVVKIYESRLRLQDRIEKDFLEETAELQSFYQKNLLKIKGGLVEKGLTKQIPAVDEEIDAVQVSEQEFIDHILQR
ncbi:MAG: serine/threonine-protein kinase [Akkermansiaceae bacterium]